MDEAWREKVRERAYAIWLREGSPEGQAEQFWLMAEEELLAEAQGRSGDEGKADQASGRPAASGSEAGTGALEGAPAPSEPR